MLKKILSSLIDHPILISLFVADFFVLVFHRPPFLFSFAMMAALVTMSMFIGQKLALFGNKD